MATSTAYRDGNVKTIVAGSDETLGTGAELLNNNFTELYDLVVPSSSLSGNTSFSVAGYPYGTGSGAYMGKTFAIPSTLGSGTTYVPTVYNDNVSYVPASSLTGNTTADASKLTYPSGSATHYYYSGGSWSTYNETLSSYPITENSIQDNSAEIGLPSFGLFLVTGTIAFVTRSSDDTTNSTSGFGRFIILGNNLQIMNQLIETYNGTAWTHDNYCVNSYTSNGKLILSNSHFDIALLSANVVGGQSDRVGGAYFSHVTLTS